MPNRSASFLVAGIVAVASFAVACNIPEVATGGGGSPWGGSDAGGEGGAGGSGTGGGGPGKNCTIPTTAGAYLCTGLAACPSVTVNQGTLAGCGFLTNSSAPFDVECECSGYLCPLGPASSGAAVAQLIAGGSSVAVCNQLSTGGCRYEGIATGSGSGGCNTACESQCVGDPTCIAGCGC